MSRIAIIGGGISGLSSAYYLSKNHEVIIYEKESSMGGHAHTVEVEVDGNIQPVDMGFIVFNDRNYPLLRKLFSELDVPFIPSKMTFAVTDVAQNVEWSADALLGQPRNIFRPSFYRMLIDIHRFFRKATHYVQNKDVTVEQMTVDLKLGKWLKNYFLYPMAAAIWSVSSDMVKNFSAKSLVTFFHEHGLLSYSNRPQWFTVDGGSRVYVDALLNRIPHQTRGEVVCIKRTKDGAVITDINGKSDFFDEVVCALHPDDALDVLDDASPEEKQILGHFKYSQQHVVLHQDQKWLPKRKVCWSSWNYRATAHEKITVSYWMNQLQSIKSKKPLIVTLNPGADVQLEGVLIEKSWKHPIFSKDTVQAQDRIINLQGQNSTWFVGAYQRYGFHEDGIWSANRVVELMKKRAL